jgi:hypothetical protein
MQPDEVLRLPNEQCLVMIRGQKPLLLYKLKPEELPGYVEITPVRITDYVPEWRTAQVGGKHDEHGGEHIAAGKNVAADTDAYADADADTGTGTGAGAGTGAKPDAGTLGAPDIPPGSPRREPPPRFEDVRSDTEHLQSQSQSQPQRKTQRFPNMQYTLTGFDDPASDTQEQETELFSTHARDRYGALDLADEIDAEQLQDMSQR